jgi:hypothetical protein
MCSLNHTTDQRKGLGYANTNVINQIELNPQINKNNQKYKNMRPKSKITVKKKLTIKKRIAIVLKDSTYCYEHVSARIA